MARRRQLWLGLLPGLLLACAEARSEIVRWVALGDAGINCVFVDTRVPKERWG